MIPQDTVNKILDAAQIVDVIGDFVTLKKKGTSYTACCQFHNEKTPSFSVSPTKGVYKCFGCGKAGTAVGFVMEHESMTYVEALKYLAKKYHIEVVEKEESAEEIAKRQEKESLYLVSEFAAKFYREALSTPDGVNIASQYFRKRGLEDETVSKYGLGWAPVGRSALVDAARAAGYKEDYLVRAGLAVKYDDGRLVDRFYDRVMFPIHSQNGRVIAFGGRTLRTDGKFAKYVNSPETEIYVKSRSLYGIYFAKSEISRQDKCILVEGYLDVLSMHQLGITNVVASSGTSLTIEQIRLIRKYTDNVTIIYDGDGAGIGAALRGIGLVLKEGLNVKVVLLPDGMDPDDFSKKNTLEQVQDYIGRNERDFIGFKTDLLLEQAGNDPLKRAELINDIADTVALIPDAIKRAVYVRACAERFQMDESIILDRINRTRTEMIMAERRQQEREMQRQADRAGTRPVQSASADYGAPLPDYGAPLPDYDLAVPDYDAPVPMDYDMGGSSVALDNGNSETAGHVASAMGGFALEEPLLAPCEKELLGFILEDGCSVLKFDRDSKYYDPDESVNVAEFIDAALSGDAYVNKVYAKVYDEYFRMYDEGLDQRQMQARLLNSQDMEIAAVAKELLIEKYQITVKAFEDSLTTNDTRLVMFVPKSLMTYQCRKLELKIKELTAELSATDDLDTQMEIMSRITNCNRARTRLNNELGRV
jgi:DNA primase